MRVLIVEDEPSAADFLSLMINRIDPSIEIIERIDSVQSATVWFQNNPHPDLAFLDIQLSDGLSFEIFDRAEVRCPVIFTTAYEEYAIKAFKVNSIDYLLKPIDPKQLSFALEKFRNFANAGIPAFQSEFTSRIAQMMDSLTCKHKSRFLVNVGPHIRTVNASDIECFYSLEKSTFLLESNGKNYDIDYSLDQLEKLIDLKLFFRINRKYLINRNFIEDIVSFSSSKLKIKLKNFSPEDLMVSSKRISDFKRWLED